MSVMCLLYDIFLYYVLFFFFNDTATTEIYTLSLHDALPISHGLGVERRRIGRRSRVAVVVHRHGAQREDVRSEEHTSELQSQSNLVCRLLLEKKKTLISRITLVRIYSSHTLIDEDYHSTYTL